MKKSGGGRGPTKGNGGKDGASIVNKRNAETARTQALTKKINQIMSENHNNNRDQTYMIPNLTKGKK